VCLARPMPNYSGKGVRLKRLWKGPKKRTGNTISPRPQVERKGVNFTSKGPGRKGSNCRRLYGAGVLYPGEILSRKGGEGKKGLDHGGKGLVSLGPKPEVRKSSRIQFEKKGRRNSGPMAKLWGNKKLGIVGNSSSWRGREAPEGRSADPLVYAERKTWKRRKKKLPDSPGGEHDYLQWRLE